MILPAIEIYVLMRKPGFGWKNPSIKGKRVAAATYRAIERRDCVFLVMA